MRVGETLVYRTAPGAVLGAGTFSPSNLDTGPSAVDPNRGDGPPSACFHLPGEIVSAGAVGGAGEADTE